jgi:hypothetical protein
MRKQEKQGEARTEAEFQEHGRNDIRTEQRRKGKQKVNRFQEENERKI